MATAITRFIKLQARRPVQYVGARLEHEYSEGKLKAETLLWQAKVRTNLPFSSDYRSSS
jgi:hypothetical protein